MSSRDYTPVSADHLRTFFDDNKLPRKSGRCPTCQYIRFFTVDDSTGKVVRISADCGHAFEIATPKK